MTNDRDLELVRFGWRDYDARAGRWTTKDPIRLAGGVNLFEYASANPTNAVDTTGLNPVVNNSNSTVTIWISNPGADPDGYFEVELPPGGEISEDKPFVFGGTIEDDVDFVDLNGDDESQPSSPLIWAPSRIDGRS